MTKQKPRIGDEAWFVEWCYELGFHDEEQELVDRDTCKERTRRVSSKAEAEALAREVWVKDDVENKLGHVRYYHATFEPYDELDAELYPGVGFWQEDEDSEYYEGPDDDQPKEADL